MASESHSELFRQRARAEAARYGSDPWVFVRELLQNARDAGANRVEIEVSREADRERVTFRDDGCGMSYEHARRYLFALYASSKDDHREQAGKFGIGFWSVLRFEPSTLVIRSCAARQNRADAWQVALDGDLGSLEESVATDFEAGTEIVLERSAGDVDDLASQVMAATRRYGRFLSRRDDPETPLPITVNGRSANAELKLEAPCATFQGKGFRGAVGLGSEPEVELFAQGLFVRSASSLQDLQAAGELSDEATATTGDVLSELPSLAPKVVIDSAELDLLLARSDARYDKHLKRILSTAEKQLGRLITRQLQALKPQPFYRLWLGALRDWLGPMGARQLAAAVLVGLGIGLALLWILPADSWISYASRPAETPPSAPLTASSDESIDLTGEAFEDVESSRGAPSTEGGSATGGQGDAETSPLPGTFAAGVRQRADVRQGRGSQELHAFDDLADRYAGPRPGGIFGNPSRLAMLYEPIETTPFFAALVIEDLGATRWAPSSVSGDLPTYRGISCHGDCIATNMLVAGGQEVVRIPVPTGHRLDVSSVRFGGRSEVIYETETGEPLLRISEPFQGVLEYRTGQAPSLRPDRHVSDRQMQVPLDAPAELMTVAEDIRRLPIEDRVQRALDYVAERVVYDRSPADWGRLASGRQPRFVELALEAGFGDCDVQSGVLVTLLRLVGVDARLALGYVGSQGTVAAGLHAWVEVLGADGRWTIADPSVALGESAGTSLLPTAFDGLRYPGPGARGSLHPAVLLAFLALLLGGAVWLWRRRPATGMELFHEGGTGAGQSDSHLAALLGGALRHPEAFAGLSAMFHGRFVPLLGRREGRSGRHISLASARRMASKNRLFRSSTSSGLARRAAARGVPVIDASSAEGRVLSLALGAIDVDHWSHLLESLPDEGQHGALSVVCQRIAGQLEELGASFRVREALEMSQPWAEVALDDLQLGERQVLVDLSHEDYAPVSAMAQDQPRAAEFALLDVLLGGIELPENERSRLLSRIARGAVEEAAGAKELMA